MRVLPHSAVLRLLGVMVLVPALAVDSGGREKGPWHGKACAVVLTYDDALNVHLDTAIPLLDSLGLRATFYISGLSPGFSGRVNDWIAAAKRGHELGNHTLFHPCAGGGAGREWVQPEYDLNTYTIRRLLDEIRMAQTLLGIIDGGRPRTFAYPCGDRAIGGASYVDAIMAEFPGARGVGQELQAWGEIDPYNVGSLVVDGHSGDDLIRRVQEAADRKALLVFLFHGVGGEHSLNIASGDHRKLLMFLKEREEEIWIAPLVDVVTSLRERGSAPPR
jgi:sialate O-acetylesterase